MARLWEYVCAAGHLFKVAWMHSDCPRCGSAWRKVSAVGAA